MKKWQAYLLGIARLFDFAGTLNEPVHKQILSRSDADALRSDWQAIGNDMWSAIRKYEDEYRG